jgi:hypothetical protein
MCSIIFSETKSIVRISIQKTAVNMCSIIFSETYIVELNLELKIDGL